MGYEICGHICIQNTASIDALDVIEILDKVEDLPETNFISKLRKPAEVCLGRNLICTHCAFANIGGSRFCSSCGKQFPTQTGAPGCVILPDLLWEGEGSHYCLKFLKDVIVPKIKGEVRVIYIYADGGVIGLAIKDGKWADCSVDMSLDVPEGW